MNNNKPNIYFDSHCHIDNQTFNTNIHTDITSNQIKLICPATHTNSFEHTIITCLEHNYYFTLGIHPLYSQDVNSQHIEILKQYITKYIDHPYFLGIGEIGLDGVCNIDINQQIYTFEHQLKLANLFDLPVITHIRKSQDQVLKYLRKYNIKKGIAHAFNGSLQQTNEYIKQGFKLGFGGNISFDRALQIRKLAQNLDIEHILLETDAPDMPPSWAYKQVNIPTNIIGIYACMAELRNIEMCELKQSIMQNIFNIFSAKMNIMMITA
ncbi:MAG: hypothetical protein RLZZ210_952 [Pseudomonadota bacterium]|jgi:TatD DNase family protein